MIRYLPLGDSYTIGEGVLIQNSFPFLLTQELINKRINIELLTNPAKTGFTTQNLIDYELPLLKKLKPNFVTLLIGVNDWVQDIDQDSYQKNLNLIIDQIIEQVKDVKNIIMVAIPDFSANPSGSQYARGRDITLGLSQFNDIALKICNNEGIKFVDVFKINQLATQEKGLTAADGLHPSGKMYQLWVDEILKVMF